MNGPKNAPGIKKTEKKLAGVSSKANKNKGF